MSGYYPPWGFYYSVKFSISGNTDDARFQSVSGLSVEYDFEEFKEGGENRFVHKLPVRTKYADLVLKRGMLTGSEVTRWALSAFRDREFKPADVDIILMNEAGNPLRTWNVTGAVPKKWIISDLNSGENAIVVETMELSYRFFSVKE